MRTGLYPGTFDPMTNGHIDIIRRALVLVDHLVIAMGINATKVPMLSFDERVALIESEIGPIAKKLGAKISTTRSEEHTSELQSLMRISYAVFCLKTKK